MNSIQGDFPRARAHTHTHTRDRERKGEKNKVVDRFSINLLAQLSIVQNKYIIRMSTNFFFPDCVFTYLFTAGHKRPTIRYYSIKYNI